MTRNVTIVGKGPAGLFAASLLQARGVSCRVVYEGDGSLSLWSGAFDSGDLDHRGLSHLSDAEWATIWSEFGSAIRAAGIPHNAEAMEGGCRTVTVTGLMKNSSIVPSWQYSTREPQPACFVGFGGLPDSMPELQSRNYHDSAGVPATYAMLDAPPGWTADWSALRYAAFFDTQQGITWLSNELVKLVERVPPEFLLLVPQVIGIRRPEENLAQLTRLSSRLVFEYPLLAPSVGGIRLRNRWESWLRSQGVAFIKGVVESVSSSAEVRLRDGRNWCSDSVVLATGGIFGGGIVVSMGGDIRDPVLDLAVGHLDDAVSPGDLMTFGHASQDPLESGRVVCVGRQLGIWNPDRDGNGGAMIAASVYAAAQMLLGATGRIN